MAAAMSSAACHGSEPWSYESVGTTAEVGTMLYCNGAIEGSCAHTALSSFCISATKLPDPVAGKFHGVLNVRCAIPHERSYRSSVTVRSIEVSSTTDVAIANSPLGNQ